MSVFLYLVFWMVWNNAISKTICAMPNHFVSLSHMFSATPFWQSEGRPLHTLSVSLFFYSEFCPAPLIVFQNTQNTLWYSYTVLPLHILSLSLFLCCYAILQLPCFLFWHFPFFSEEIITFFRRSHSMSAKIQGQGNLNNMSTTTQWQSNSEIEIRQTSMSP